VQFKKRTWRRNFLPPNNSKIYRLRELQRFFNPSWATNRNILTHQPSNWSTKLFIKHNSK